MAAARETGRSVSEEIEYRLGESVRNDHLVDALTGGGNSTLRAIAFAMLWESDWRKNKIAGEIVRRAVNIILAGAAELSAAPPELDHDAAVHAEILAGNALRRAGVKLKATDS